MKTSLLITLSLTTALAFIGTYFMHLTADNIEQFLAVGLVVFADVRFQNEAERVRKAGGQIWRVERDGIEAPNKHVSEFDLEGYRFDKVLHNYGTLDDLYDQIDFLMGRLK